LPDLLREFGFDAQAFSPTRAFLLSDYLDATKCLIFDVAMPGMTGLQLCDELLTVAATSSRKSSRRCSRWRGARAEG
jgi:FixJ family two-component response regulator